MSKVIIRRADEGLREIISDVFDAFGVELQGKKVLVKPNIVAAFPPGSGVCTSPEVVEAVVSEALDRGGDVVVGDNPGGVDKSSYATAERAGIVAASRGRFRNISEQVVRVPTDSPYTDEFVISRVILEADVIINLPCFKTHVLTTITGAIKNVYGYVAGTNKARLHLQAPSRRRFSEMLCDLYRVRVPDLHIMDGLLAMEGNGPTHGRVRELGLILASDDGLALDATMARMMGIDPASVKMLAIAHERGLGELEEDKIEVVGEPLRPIPNFALPTSFSASPAEQVVILDKLGKLVPVLDEERCAACGDCELNCPAGALTLDPLPVITAEKCISCFCCVELCPEGAMEVPEGVAPDLFDRMFR